MKKTLIEQWRDGKLPNGDYYIKVRGRLTGNDFFVYDNCINGKLAYTSDGNIIDIIEKVPSYEEWQSELASNNELLNVQKRLEKRLEIATKALKIYSKDDYYSEGGGRSVNPYPHIARKALKEMEKVE